LGSSRLSPADPGNADGIDDISDAGFEQRTRHLSDDG
jgi:hypothetical protein